MILAEQTTTDGSQNDEQTEKDLYGGSKTKTLESAIPCSDGTHKHKMVYQEFNKTDHFQGVEKQVTVKQWRCPRCGLVKYTNNADDD